MLERDGQLEAEERREEEEGGVVVPFSGIRATVVFAGGDAEDSVLDVEDAEEAVVDADDFGVSSPEEEDEERDADDDFLSLVLSLSLARLFSTVVGFLVDDFCGAGSSFFLGGPASLPSKASWSQTSM